MSAISPCYRHARKGWMAACADCTVWHMAAAIARREEPDRGDLTVVPTAGRPGTPSGMAGNGGAAGRAAA